MSDRPGFDKLGDERFVSLTTFRKTGVAVSSPVWIARDGDALLVTTPVESGKVKRLRNNPRVEMRPSTRRGQVEDGVLPVAGTVELITDEATKEAMTEIFKKKYGFEYRLIMGIERVAARRQKPRVMLRITPER